MKEVRIEKISMREPLEAAINSALKQAGSDAGKILALERVVTQPALGQRDEGRYRAEQYVWVLVFTVERWSDDRVV